MVDWHLSALWLSDVTAGPWGDRARTGSCLLGRAQRYPRKRKTDLGSTPDTSTSLDFMGLGKFSVLIQKRVKTDINLAGWLWNL